MSGPTHEAWALAVLHDAGRAAARKGAPVAALRYLRHALDVADPGALPPRLLIDLGLAEAAAGEPMSFNHFEQALELISEPDERADAPYCLGQTLYRFGRGHVVNITTSLIEFADVNIPSALTSVTKGGLVSVTKSLAIEYARNGIRVNAVSPGVIDTPMHAEVTHPFLEGTLRQGRLGTVADIVQGVRYLEDAQFVTGEILPIDGGQGAGR